MKFTLVLLAFILIIAPEVSAYSLSITDIDQPYEIVTIEGSLEEGESFLGELNSFPVMYEVIAEENIDLDVQIRQRYNNSDEPYGFSLILIRQNERDSGVTEVSRLRPKPDDWTVAKDSAAGMTFWESDLLSQTIEPGVYRIEISTSDNTGQYMLTFGNQERNSGYFQTIRDAHTTQKFFDYSFFRILTSSYVYYTLGILLLLVAIYRTWKYRNSIVHAG
ncbi:MAG: hypothetical protein LR008_00730 [Candidatus Pacebacteria bacterium]|nr:hypothetical protein [Candidatus Paceibacterota bacterium]